MQSFSTNQKPNWFLLKKLLWAFVVASTGFFFIRHLLNNLQFGVDAASSLDLPQND